MEKYEKMHFQQKTKPEIGTPVFFCSGGIFNQAHSFLAIKIVFFALKWNQLSFIYKISNKSIPFYHV